MKLVLILRYQRRSRFECQPYYSLIHKLVWLYGSYQMGLRINIYLAAKLGGRKRVEQVITKSECNPEMDWSISDGQL